MLNAWHTGRKPGPATMDRARASWAAGRGPGPASQAMLAPDAQGSGPGGLAENSFPKVKHRTCPRTSSHMQKMVPVSGIPQAPPSPAPPRAEQQQNPPFPPAPAQLPCLGMLQCRWKGLATPLTELVPTAVWIPHRDVLQRKVRRVFLHHVSDPREEEEGAETISSIYGYSKARPSSPALLQWDHRESQCPIPAALRWVRATDKAGGMQSSSQGEVQHGDAHHTAQNTDPHCTCAHSLLCLGFPTFSLLKGKKPKRCLENCRMLPFSFACSQQ